jgi:hypothetical protein
METQLAVVTAQLKRMRTAFLLMCVVSALSSISLVLTYLGGRQMHDRSEASCSKREQELEASNVKLERIAKEALSFAEDCRSKSK